MKNKTLIFFLLLFLIAAPAFAETQTTIKEFYAGSFSFDLGFNTDFLYGARGDGLREGGTVSTLDFNQSFTSNNPSCLAFLTRGVSSLGFIPFPIISSGVIEKFMGQDFDATLTEIINNGLRDSFSDVTKAAGVDVQLNTLNVHTYAGQSNGFTGFEIMLPFAKNQASIAFARENRLSFDMKALLNGLETLINITDPDQPMLNVDIRAKLNALIKLQADNIVTSVGVGRKLTPEWGVGAVVEHYDSRFGLDASGQVDGTATYAGSTFQFNTDDAHSLEQSATAAYTAEAWGVRFGSSYHFMANLMELGADVSIQPEIKYTGNASVLYHTLPDSIDLSDITKTQAKTVEDIEDGTMKIKIPSFIRFTFAYRPGMIISVNYTHYFDSFALKFHTAAQDTEFHYDMYESLRVGFNFSVFQFGAGVIYSKLWKKEDGNYMTLAWVPLPVASAGSVIPFGDNILWEVELIAFPLPICKTAITYMF